MGCQPGHGHFQAIAASRFKLPEKVPQALAGHVIGMGVGQNSGAAGRMDRRNAFFKGAPGGGHKCRLALFQKTVERVAMIADSPGLLQQLCKPGATRCVVVGQLTGSLVTVCQSGGPIQAPADFPGAVDTGFILGADPGLQGRVIHIDPQPQHMEFTVIVANRQLNPVDQGHSARLRGLAGFIQSAQGVVVGQGQMGDAIIRRPRHQISGRQRAIGGEAVAMQVKTRSHKGWLSGYFADGSAIAGTVSMKTGRLRYHNEAKNNAGRQGELPA